MNDICRFVGICWDSNVTQTMLNEATYGTTEVLLCSKQLKPIELKLFMACVAAKLPCHPVSAASFHAVGWSSISAAKPWDPFLSSQFHCELFRDFPGFAGQPQLSNVLHGV